MANREPQFTLRAPDERWQPLVHDVAFQDRGDGTYTLIRPGQLLVRPGIHPDALKALHTRGWRPLRSRDRRQAVRYIRRDRNGADSLEETTQLQREFSEELTFNHVFAGATGPTINYAGCPRVWGGPGDLVTPLEGPPDGRPRAGCSVDGNEVRIGVIDTGLLPPRWLMQFRFNEHQSDIEVMDADHDHILDTEAGHGTFISGICMQIAPAATVATRRVLTSVGFADDTQIASAVNALAPEVDLLNLSLGGYTADDGAPLALSTAIRNHPRLPVIAAAGNDGRADNFYPAALGYDNVTGVGATDRTGAHMDWSNHGASAQTWAPGEKIHSTFPYFSGVDSHGAAVEFKTGWASWSGTSFAAPVFAASAAVLVSQGYEPADAVQAVISDLSPNGYLDVDLLAGVKHDPLPDMFS